MGRSIAVVPVATFTKQSKKSTNLELEAGKYMANGMLDRVPPLR